MLAGTAIAGMSKYDVLKSMGHSQDIEKTSEVSDEARRSSLTRSHTFEVLHYYDKDQAVYLDSEGTVITVKHYQK